MSDGLCPHCKQPYNIGSFKPDSSRHKRGGHFHPSTAPYRGKRQKRKSPLFLILGIGCGVILFFLAGLAVMIALNWSRIQGFTQDMSDLAPVHGSLARKYKAQNMQVTVQWQTGVGGKTLNIEIVNIIVPPTSANRTTRSLAKEIASFAISKHPNPSTFKQVRVTITNRQGVGIAFNNKEMHTFGISELQNTKASDE